MGYNHMGSAKVFFLSFFLLSFLSSCLYVYIQSLWVMANLCVLNYNK